MQVTMLCRKEKNCNSDFKVFEIKVAVTVHAAEPEISYNKLDPLILLSSLV